MLPERTLNEDGIEMHFATNHIGHFLFTCLIMPKLLKAAETNPKGATRVVNVSAGSPYWAYMRWSDPNFEKKNKDLPAEEQPNFATHKEWGTPDIEERSYVPLEAYNQSKVANLLFSIGATRRLYEKHGILCLTVHPGWIKTELQRAATSDWKSSVESLIMKTGVQYKTLGAGSSTSLVAALDPKLGKIENKDGKENVGIFLEHCQVTDKAHPRACSSEEADKLWTASERLVREKFSW